MTIPPDPGAGTVVSADIAVPNHQAVVAFYSSVLGTGERPLWRDDLMNSLGTPVIGIGERTSEYDHLPLQWMPHIQVADVAASAEAAVELGGQELVHSRDDRGRSQWAVLMDPDGAAFGVIPVVPQDEMPQPAADGSDEGTPSGRIAWLDLTVTDAEAARDYYGRVVGWSSEDVPMVDAAQAYVDFAMCDPEGRSVAGVCHARGANRDLPAAWLIYLPVGDLAQSLERVREGGGEVVLAQRGDEGRYAHAVVRDPAGACIGLVPG